jgi:hypothetical protein
MERLRTYGADGIGFYDYPAVFSNPMTAVRTAAIRDFFESIDNPPQPGVGNVLDDFEVDEGHFNWPYNTSPVSQTFGLTGDTTTERVTELAHRGVGSQKLQLVAEGGGSWQMRHNSGLGQVAHPNGNVPLEPSGYVGFWLKTANAGVTVRISIDDPTTTAGSTALERSIALAVTGDDQWRLYEWNLDDAGQWDAFAGGADGDIDAFLGTVSVDSIWFAGAGDATVYMDTVSHNPDGHLAAPPMPADFNQDGTVDSDDLAEWNEFLGKHADALPSEGDADGNGVVDGADFLAWQQQFGKADEPVSEAAAAAVPEPTAGWLAAGLLALLLMLAWRERLALASETR